jgi:nucleotide-binding universal stress UspA family protein
MKIVLAINCSPGSANAVRATVSRPWPRGTAVRVVSVVEPLLGWSLPELEDSLRQSAERTVQDAADALRTAGLKVETAVLTGDPKTDIVNTAKAWNADLIVIGSHSMDSVMEFLLGGVARSVARLASCSVEIVRKNPESQPLRVLMATDGSDYSNIAVRSVADRPWPGGTEFRILSVVEPSSPLLHPPFFSEHVMEEVRAKDMQRAQAAISTAEAILCRAGIQAGTALAVPSATAKELILAESAEWNADMIVVGSHGRRGVNRLMLGSVSEAVALHAQCSVEIIRQRV